MGAKPVKSPFRAASGGSEMKIGAVAVL